MSREIDVQDEYHDGKYVNLVSVTATFADVVLECYRQVPISIGGDELPELRLVERLLMSPQEAKVLLKLLESVVQEWEGRHGQLPLPSEDAINRVSGSADTPESERGEDEGL